MFNVGDMNTKKQSLPIGDDGSKIIILSRIEHFNEMNNESKSSEMELELLLNMSDDNYPKSVRKATNQNSCQNLSLKSSFQ